MSDKPGNLRWIIFLALLSLLVWPPATTIAAADHLILSEVVMQIRPPAATFGSKFVEIVNPTADEIDLSQVYLTDGTNGPSTYYYNIVKYSGAGGGTGGDFHCRFPQGAVLAAGDTLVVSISGSSQYLEAYDRLPDFELFEDGLVPDAVPEMVEAFPGAVNAGLGGGGNVPDLSTTAETVILYSWDGQSDLVQDLDYLIWGSVSSVRTSKTGISIDGPDPGEDPTAYQPDTATGNQQVVSTSAHAYGGAYRRLSADEGTETATGGNGLTGHDETSEPLNATWQLATAQEPPTAPASLFPAAPILMDVGLDPLEPYTGQATTVTVELVSFNPVTQMRLFYNIDGSRFTEVAGSDAGGGIWSAEIPPQAAGAVVGWYLQVIGGGTATYPVVAPTVLESFTVSGSPPPEFSNVTLEPPSPYMGVPTVVAARLGGPLPAVTASLFYGLDGGAFVEAVCQQDGDIWSAEIPGQPAGTEVRWYLQAEASGGGVATYPAGAPAEVESFTVTEEPAPVDAAVQLLLTEVCTKGSSAEFVEIHNPTREAVDLSHYALSDAIYAPDSQYYWNIVRPNPGATTAGGGTFADFHARFPAGAIIGPGEVVTIAIAGSGAFFENYAEQPDFELIEDGTQSDNVPDLVEVFPGSIMNATSTPGLSNASETLVLYWWDGQSDLVTDIDVFFWGNDDRWRFSKTGVSIDGIDPDSAPSSYQPETTVFSQNPFLDEHDFGDSYQRVDLSEGTEIETGSNGVGGNDEVSENMAQTWQMQPVTPGWLPVAGEEGGRVTLQVPGRTFLPLRGETFPILFTSKSNYETVVRIFDLEGRLIKTLFNSVFDGPALTDPAVRSSQRNWDGRDEQFELVPAGMYVVHLSAVNPVTGDQTTSTAPAVVATRLSN